MSYTLRLDLFMSIPLTSWKVLLVVMETMPMCDRQVAGKRWEELLINYGIQIGICYFNNSSVQLLESVTSTTDRSSGTRLRLFSTNIGICLSLSRLSVFRHKTLQSLIHTKQFYESLFINLWYYFQGSLLLPGQLQPLLYLLEDEQIQCSDISASSCI